MAARYLTGLQRMVGERARLKSLYKKILRLTEKFPKEAAYRINTEAIICHRLSIVNRTDDPNEIEEIICCGNMRMLISQAKAEYELCQRMILWRCWEPLKEHPPSGQWKWPPIIK